MGRIPIRKKLRFQVFHRDSFTCRYCGSTPPDVVLHVDHLVPVVEGGDNEIDNLLTACSACNLGKGRRLLNEQPPAANIDLKYLEVAQERLELESYIYESKRREELEAEAIKRLDEVWHSVLFPSGLKPSETQYKKWFTRFGPSEIEEAFRCCIHAVHNRKVSNSTPYEINQMFAYLTAILRAKKEDAA